MKKLLILTFCLAMVTPVFAAESAKELSHDYNMIFQQFLREKLITLHKGDEVIVFLKDKTIVCGTFESFVKYDDSLWIVPSGKHGLFSDIAYDISDLLDVKVLVSRGI